MPEGPRLPSDLVEVHRRYNRNSADLWESFADHRTRTTALAMGAGGETLAVLGAGNCNDLDLPALGARFREIHLVDVDADALRRARDRQPAETAQKLVLHAPVDLSGALAALKALGGQLAPRAQLASLTADAVARVRAALPGSFDTVLSASLLSQIAHSCRVALGAGHPQLEIIANALAVAHLRLMTELLLPGGTAVLVTDTSTSSIHPPLAQQWGSEPPIDLLERLQREEKLLSGTTPALLLRTLTTDPALTPLIGSPRVIDPWLWRLGPLTLLVYALVFPRLR